MRGAVFDLTSILLPLGLSWRSAVLHLENGSQRVLRPFKSSYCEREFIFLLDFGQLNAKKSILFLISLASNEIRKRNTNPALVGAKFAEPKQERISQIGSALKSLEGSKTRQTNVQKHTD